MRAGEEDGRDCEGEEVVDDPPLQVEEKGTVGEDSGDVLKVVTKVGVA